METLQMGMGRRVKWRRMEQHLMQKDLARLTGWQPDYLSRFERGDWTHIDPAKLCAIAQALGVSVDYLLGRTNGEGAQDERDRPSDGDRSLVVCGAGLAGVPLSHAEAPGRV